VIGRDFFGLFLGKNFFSPRFGGFFSPTRGPQFFFFFFPGETPSCFPGPAFTFFFFPPQGFFSFLKKKNLHHSAKINRACIVGCSPKLSKHLTGELSAVGNKRPERCSFGCRAHEGRVHQAHRSTNRTGSCGVTRASFQEIQVANCIRKTRAEDLANKTTDACQRGECLYSKTSMRVFLFNAVAFVVSMRAHCRRGTLPGCNTFFCMHRLQLLHSQKGRLTPTARCRKIRTRACRFDR